MRREHVLLRSAGLTRRRITCLHLRRAKGQDTFLELCCVAQRICPFFHGGQGCLSVHGASLEWHVDWCTFCPGRW